MTYYGIFSSKGFIGFPPSVTDQQQKVKSRLILHNNAKETLSWWQHDEEQQLTHNPEDYNCFCQEKKLPPPQ